MIQSGNKNIDNTIVIAVVILIAYVAFKLFKVVSNPLGEVFDVPADTDLPDSNLPIDYSKITHPVEQFDIWSVELYDSIWGFIADKQTIREIMYQINSDDDLKLIIKKYGVQTSLGGLVGGEGQLPTHLRDVMDSEDINGFNSHFEGWGMGLRI